MLQRSNQFSLIKVLCISQITTQVLIVMAVTYDESAFPNNTSFASLSVIISKGTISMLSEFSYFLHQQEMLMRTWKTTARSLELI